MSAKESVNYQRGSLPASWNMSRIRLSHWICHQTHLELSYLINPNHVVGIKVQLVSFKYEKYADDLFRDFKHMGSYRVDCSWLFVCLLDYERNTFVSEEILV